MDKRYRYLNPDEMELFEIVTHKAHVYRYPEFKKRIKTWRKGKGAQNDYLINKFYPVVAEVWEDDDENLESFLQRFFPKRQSRLSSRVRVDDATLWKPVNHSNPKIVPVSEESGYRKERIRCVLKKGYRITGVDDVGDEGQAPIKRVDEESASVNYRVECVGPKGVGKEVVLFRVHKRIETELAIRALHEIQRVVFESKVFSGDFNDCLQPIPRARTKAEYRLEEFKLDEEDGEEKHLITVFPFADNVQHYSGEHLGQLESLAQKYAALQKKLRDWDFKSLNLSPKRGAHKYIHWHERPETYRVLFDLICTINDVAWQDESQRSGITREWYENSAVLKSAWGDIEDMLFEQGKRSKNPVLLHDFHPHNTFFKNDTCVLIYDYEDVGRYWSEEEVLAFTLHRFVREYVISLKGPTTITNTVVGRVVDTFLENYESGGMSVPPGFDDWNAFKKWLPSGIRLTNFPKLLVIMSLYHRIRGESAQRTEGRWLKELIKFIMFIKEAQFFKPE